MTTEKKMKKLKRKMLACEILFPFTAGLSAIPFAAYNRKYAELCMDVLDRVDDVSEACLNTINVMFEETGE